MLLRNRPARIEGQRKQHHHQQCEEEHRVDRLFRAPLDAQVLHQVCPQHARDHWTTSSRASFVRSAVCHRHVHCLSRAEVVIRAQESVGCPRVPAETLILSNRIAVSSTKTGNAFLAPKIVTPPRIYPVNGCTSLSDTISALRRPAALGQLLEVQFRIAGYHRKHNILTGAACRQQRFEHLFRRHADLLRHGDRGQIFRIDFVLAQFERNFRLSRKRAPLVFIASGSLARTCDAAGLAAPAPNRRWAPPARAGAS